MTASLRARLVIGVYVGCFCLGILSHARDFAVYGWSPYPRGVPVLTVFWTSLILLDAGVVVLLLAGFRRAGMAAALTVMACDVAANSYALFALGIEAFAAGLVMQAAFFGFVAGSIAFVWPSRSPCTAESRS